ncbi:FecR domain-containing protein [Pseudomonas chlororaphis]|uniref:FecR domain-containing protein n=1 Tax=Pseudomonas chlororaphis TaxID=587753 RepID=UPI0023653377|nr:FecR domain-containing protein [Pseudomonas chlororaphis]WDH19982.1 FecR domain-containing protein [Pseudomonas chlororaphis]
MLDTTCPQTVRAQQEAAHWYSVLSSGEVNDLERNQWQTWLSAAPEHARAWALVEEVVSRFQGLPPTLAQTALDTPALDRRAALKLLGILYVTGGALAVGMNTSVWERELAGLTTGTGEVRSWTLADGSRLSLNARSSVDVLFESRQRLVRLYRGEILIETGHAMLLAQSPFLVETEQGLIRALGTRFMVRARDHEVEVSLFEGALEIQPYGAAVQRLRAGEAARLQRSKTSLIHPQAPHAAAWERGLIFADGMPLNLYLRQLAQYRPGILSCDSVAATLRVSGVFELADSDRLLVRLQEILPVRVRYFSRYWVRVEALTTGV